jgi:hypothetical protein
LHISLDQLRWHRLTRSGLITPFTSAGECAEALIGIQAQMPRAAALAIASRINRFSFREFEFLLYRQRSLIRTWGQRDTLHVYRSSDWRSLVDTFRNRHSWAYAKFQKAGGSDVEYEQFIEKIGDVLKSSKPLTRDEISRHTGIESSAWGGLLIDAAYRGFVSDAGDRRFSHGLQWTSNLSVADERKCTCLLNLVQRYLRCYGPAGVEDVAFWLKEKTTIVKRLFTKLNLIKVLCDGAHLFALQEDHDNIASLSPPQYAQKWPTIILYRFDPLLLAHKTKEWIVPAEHYDKVWMAGGHVAGVILRRGVATAKWHYKKGGGQYSIDVTSFSGSKISQSIKSKVVRHEKFLNNFFGN